MNPHDFAAAVISYTLQSGFLLLAGLLAPRVLRLQHPKALLIYWRVLFAVVLLLPLATTFWQPRSALPVFAIDGIAVEEIVAISLPTELSTLSWRLLLVPGGIITLLALARLAAGILYLGRCRRVATPLTENSAPIAALQRRLGLDVPFAITDRLSVPLTFGWARPIVLVPPLFRRLSADEQEGVACHELLHVQRKDWPMTLLEEVLRAVFWFHPAAWVLIEKIAVSREQVVDACAVEITGKRRQYLDALWQVVCTCQRHPTALAVPLIGRSHLRARVEHLKREIKMSRTRMIASIAALGAVLIAAAIVGAAVFPPASVSQADTSAMKKSWSSEDDEPNGDEKLRTKDFDGECAEITKPVEIEKTVPKYPEEARLEKVMGMVIVETVITVKGLVDDVKVLESPDERLSAAAVEAARQWRFEPALCDGKPASVYYKVTFNFRLE